MNFNSFSQLKTADVKKHAQLVGSYKKGNSSVRVLEDFKSKKSGSYKEAKAKFDEERRRIIKNAENRSRYADYNRQTMGFHTSVVQPLNNLFTHIKLLHEKIA